MAETTKTGSYLGYREEPLSWDELLEIFDTMFDEEARDLRTWPQAMRNTHVSWTDGEGINHEVESLDELSEAYARGLTAVVRMSDSITSGYRGAFLYVPGGPQPGARVDLHGAPNDVDRRLEVIQRYFPRQEVEEPLLFLSWSGKRSRKIARCLQGVLQTHLPSVKVFFSETSIDPGDDPDRAMLEDGLLRAVAVIAVLTKEAASRPWVIWETAATWARERVVIPIFVGVKPSEVGGPLTAKFEGVAFRNRDRMDQMLVRAGALCGVADPGPITDDEWRSLKKL